MSVGIPRLTGLFLWGTLLSTPLSRIGFHWSHRRECTSVSCEYRSLLSLCDFSVLYFYRRQLNAGWKSANNGRNSDNGVNDKMREGETLAGLHFLVCLPAVGTVALGKKKKRRASLLLISLFLCCLLAVPPPLFSLTLYHFTLCRHCFGALERRKRFSSRLLNGDYKSGNNVAVSRGWNPASLSSWCQVCLLLQWLFLRCLEGSSHPACVIGY